MSIQTISIPWASDTSDSIHLQWDDSSITGGQRVTLPVTVTSDYNYTGEDRETLVTFRTISPTDFDQNINLFSLSELEQGAINNGTGVPAASNMRLRSKNFQPISGKYISIDSLNNIYKFLWLFYDEEYSYINKPVSWDWITSFPTVAEIPEGAAYVKYQITRNDNAVLTPESAKEDCLIKVGIGEERFAEKALKIIQTSDNLIIATHTDVYSIYSSNKAGIKQ